MRQMPKPNGWTLMSACGISTLKLPCMPRVRAPSAASSRDSKGSRLRKRTLNAILFVPVLCFYHLGYLGFNCRLFAVEATSNSRVIAEVDAGQQDCALLIPISIETPNTSSLQSDPIVLQFLVDTASTLTIFDRRHAAALGRSSGRKIGRALSGPAEIELYAPPCLKIGGLRLQPKGDVGCLDLKSISDAMGERVDGFLGMDVLRALVFSIDFDRRKLTFYRDAGAMHGNPVPIIWKPTLVRDCPFVRASVDGATMIDFLVDTGAVWPIAGSLDESVYDGLAESGHLLPIRGSYSALTPTSVIALTHARMNGFSLGSNSHNGLAFFRLRFPNCLSVGYLSRYFVVFDFPASQMYLTPAKGYGRVDICDRVGLGLAKDAACITVTGVSSGSSGSSAGFRKADAILSIDGKSTKGMTVRQAWQYLSRDGHHLIIVSRDDRKQEISMEVKPDFVPR